MDHRITIQHQTTHFVGNSFQSTPVTVRSPPVPQTPIVSVREEKQLGHVTLSWPTHDQKVDQHYANDAPNCYMVYVGLTSNPNTVLHGKVEVKNLKVDLDGKNFEYGIENLKIGQSYNVFVQVIFRI